VERRRLQNEKLYDVYSSPNIIQVSKVIRMRWAGNVARMVKRRGANGVWCGNQRERDNLEDQDVDVG